MELVLLLVLLVFIVTANCVTDFYFSSELPRHAAELGQVVISPFGIWTLMTEIAVGATNNSYNQLSTAFDFPKNQEDLINDYKNITNILSPKTDQVHLSSNNFVFLDKSFEVLPGYKQAIQVDLDSAFKILDFGDTDTAAKEANSLIESVAGVTNVLKPNQFSDPSMILTNVISFKGLWTSPFNRSDTVKEPFRNEENEQLGFVNMMFQAGGFPYSDVKELQSSVLELSYGNDGKYAMLFILPHPRNKKVSEVYQQLSTFGVKDIFKILNKDLHEFGLISMNVKIPRFRIKTDLSMTEPLKKMGVYDIFDESLANFEKLSEQRVFVSSVIHNADIEVPEEGTSATAVSAAKYKFKAGPLEFSLNRPFIYLVVAKPSSTVLFSGIYSSPSAY